MRKLVGQLIKMWRDLNDNLSKVDSDPNVKKYGSTVREGRRAELISSWQENALATIQHFRNEDAPRLREEREAARQSVLSNIARGLPVTGSRKPSVPDLSQTYASEVEKYTISLLAGLADRFDALHQQLRIANSLSLASMEPTQSLQSRVNAYMDDAQQGEAFDYGRYSVDRLVLPAILRKRALEGDLRAGVTLETLPKIENSLVERALGSADDVNPFYLDKSEDVIQRATGPEANLKGAGQWLETLARGIERGAAETANDKPKPPRPKSDDEASFSLATPSVSAPAFPTA